METDEALAMAGKQIKLADHMLYVTYPLVKDKRLLSNVVLYMEKGLILMVSAFLSWEYTYKRIKGIPESDKLKVQLFLQRYNNRFKVSANVLKLFEIRDIDEKSVKFEKDNHLVMISPQYQVQKVSLDELKKYLSSLKNLLNMIKNEVDK